MMIGFNFNRDNQGNEMANIKSEYVMLLTRFTSKSDKHAGLQYIHVQPHEKGGILLCALNGQTMGAVHDQHGACKKSFLLEVRPEMLKHCKAGVSDERFVVVDENGYATVQDELGGVLHIEALPVVVSDEEFPNWLDVLDVAIKQAGTAKKEETPVLPSDLTPFYLTTRQARCFTLRTTTKHGPVIVRHDDFPEFVGILMPLKNVSEESCVNSVAPAWVADAKFIEPGHEAQAEEKKEVKSKKGAAPKVKAKDKASIPPIEAGEKAPETVVTH